MKSARIIAQEIAEILKGDVIAAVRVSEFFAPGELMEILQITDTAAAARIEYLEAQIVDLTSEVDALVDENHHLKLTR